MLHGVFFMSFASFETDRPFQHGYGWSLQIFQDDLDLISLSCIEQVQCWEVWMANNIEKLHANIHVILFTELHQLHTAYILHSTTIRTRELS